MRRAPSLTDAPGANAPATIARFCSSLHRRRRSGPDITSTRLIAPSFAPVQKTSLAPVPERAGSIPRAQGGRYRTVTKERLGLTDLFAINPHPADEGLLHDVLSVRHRAQHAIGDTHEARA